MTATQTRSCLSQDRGHRHVHGPNLTTGLLGVVYDNMEKPAMLVRHGPGGGFTCLIFVRGCASTVSETILFLLTIFFFFFLKKDTLMQFLGEKRAVFLGYFAKM